jgi:LDH2 family malate/lactate/ureidoglycolate dehydrogenase
MQPELSLEVARLIGGVAQVLHGAGVTRDDAHAVAKLLVSADQEGISSHGVMLVPMYVERLLAGSVSATAQPVIVEDRDAVVVIDAQNTLGQISSAIAVDRAVERAQRFGAAAVAVRNGFHFGTGGAWASAIAKHGMVGIALSNTRPLMPAPGGAQPVTGNNPLAIAVPSAEGAPLVLDMAMSASAMGKIRLAAARGASIPADWATDSEGTPTTDPAAAIKGMLLPAAGPKGFGLAVMIDLLCGGLAAGGVGGQVKPLYGDPSKAYGCSHLFIALDIARFLPLASFGATVSALSAQIRASRRTPGVEQLFMPGDIAARAAERHRDTLTLPRALIESLDATARQVGIESPFTTELSEGLAS